MNSNTLSKEELRSLYWDEGMTLAQIGKQFSVATMVVHRWMKKHGIPARSKSEALSHWYAGLEGEEKERARQNRRESMARAREAVTPEAMQRGAEKRKGNSPPNKGGTWTDGQRRKLKEIRATKEYREKLSASKKGKPMSEEHRKSLLAAFSTDEHRRRRSEAKRGSKAPGWKGGISYGKYDRLNTWQWRKRREEVYERDENTCQRCGVRCTKEAGPKRRQCHHVVPARLGGSDDMDNLTTLCTTCHTTVEWECREAPNEEGEQPTLPLAE